MRKFIVLSLTVALMLGMGAGVVWADITFPNNTVVQAYLGNGVNNANAYLNASNSIQSGPAGWYDVIGTHDPNFQTYGGILSGTTLTLYTQFGGANFQDTGVSPASVVADLFLDTNLDGAFDTAVRMRGSTPGTGDGSVYTGLTSANWYTSFDKYKGGGVVYGGKYDPSAPKDVPVEVHGVSSSTTTSVTWAQLASAITLGTESVPAGAWAATVNLNGIVDPDAFAFLWATGTCANDTAEGKVVPLPGALLLLGAGLVRLAGYARRKRSPA